MISEAPAHHRDAAVDALRGLSILAVVFYHYRPVGWDVFSQGFYGVTLFFMISGYCMPPSLAASTSLRHFWSKRIARLVPAMVVCGFISTAVKHGAGVLPGRLDGWADWVKSSICIPTVDLPCQLSGWLIGRFNEYSYPDGAYWSLLTEFRFYLLIGVLFWLVRGRRLGVALAIVTCLVPAYWLAFGGHAKWLDELLPYLPAFLAGVGIYEWRHNMGGRVAFAGVAISLAAMRWVGVRPYSMPIVMGAAPIAFAICFALLFAATGPIGAKVRLGAGYTRGLAMIGLVSYPFYLLHQDLGLVTLALLPHLAGWFMRMIALPAVMFGLAYLVHRTIEYRYQRRLVAWLTGARKASTRRRWLDSEGASR